MASIGLTLASFPLTHAKKNLILNAPFLIVEDGRNTNNEISRFERENGARLRKNTYYSNGRG